MAEGPVIGGLWDECAFCGHVRAVHEPHCVVTYYAAKRACPADCREFVEAV